MNASRRTCGSSKATSMVYSRGDHKYGQHTTDALKHKRRQITELLNKVDAYATVNETYDGFFGVWGRWTHMQRAECELLKVHRLEGRQWQNRIHNDLWEACRLNKSAEKWRLSRILAGTQMGAKRRRLNVPAADIPTVREWAQHMKQKGPARGCEGAAVRVGPMTEIPPERDGLIHVAGVNRKGWTSTQHKTANEGQATQHDTKASHRHFLRTGADWQQTHDEQPTPGLNTLTKNGTHGENPP